MSASNQLVSPVKGPWNLLDVDNKFVAPKEVDVAINSIQQGILKIVAIVGAQGGGKSSLLNGAFNTSFETQKDGIDRTTCGIDVSVDPDARLLILDVEGSDSDARSDSGDTERRFMAFTLLYCDMVIINMEERDIAKIDGFNSSLLSNAIEARLDISTNDGGSSSKTLLLFALRDSSLYAPGGNPSQEKKKAIEVERLKKLKTKVNALWDNIKKPERFGTASVDQFFDIGVRLFPNKLYCPDVFQSCAQEFGRACKEDPELIKQIYSQEISSRECFDFMKRAHETIKRWESGNVPLDHSLQCLRAVNRQHMLVQKEINALYRQARQSSEHPFPSAIPKLLETIHAAYDEDCRSFHPDARIGEKTQLMERLHQELQPFFNDYKLHLSQQLKQRHQFNLEEYASANLVNYVNSAKASHNVCIDKYCKEASKAANLTGIDPLPYNEEVDELDRSLQLATRDAALTLAEFLSREKGRYTEGDLDELRNVLAQDATKFSWEGILMFYKTAQIRAETSLVQSLEEIETAKEKQLELVLACSSLLWEGTIRQIHESQKLERVLQSMQVILAAELEEAINLHAPSTDISQWYLRATKKAYEYLEIAACIRVDDPTVYGIPAGAMEREDGGNGLWWKAVIEPSQAEVIKERFNQELEKRKVEDLRIQMVRIEGEKLKEKEEVLKKAMRNLEEEKKRYQARPKKEALQTGKDILQTVAAGASVVHNILRIIALLEGAGGSLGGGMGIGDLLGNDGNGQEIQELSMTADRSWIQDLTNQLREMGEGELPLAGELLMQEQELSSDHYY